VLKQKDIKEMKHSTANCIATRPGNTVVDEIRYPTI
jgi:hypothetical protein